MIWLHSFNKKLRIKNEEQFIDEYGYIYIKQK
jgi:hypothetical protein